MVAAPESSHPFARLTRVVKDVQISSPTTSVRASKLGDSLPEKAALRTGAAARAEVTLAGPSIVRMGGKTTLRFGEEGRTIELGEGLALFQVPRAAKVTIRTGSINLEARGTTGLIERNGAAYVKILVLEGEARVYTSRLGESVLVSPGQLLITSPKTLGLPETVHFDLGHLYKTSLLLNAGFAPLASRAGILQEIDKQKRDPQFIPTNLVIFGRGTLVNIVPEKPAAARAASPIPSIGKPRKP